MPSVSPSPNPADLPGYLQDALKILVSTTSMGYVGYILLLIASIGIFALSMWIKAKQIEQAKKDSEAQANKDQAQNQTDNQTISHADDAASGKIEDVRKEDPDTGKKPRGT